MLGSTDTAFVKSLLVKLCVTVCAGFLITWPARLTMAVTVAARELRNTTEVTSIALEVSAATAVVQGVDMSVETRNLLLNFLGAVANNIALVGLVKKKDFSIRFKIPIMGLMLADQEVNIVVFFLSVMRVGGFASRALCNFVFFSCLVGIFSNPPLVLALAIDRLFAVFTPLSYRQQLHPTRTAVLMLLTAFGVGTALMLVMMVPANSQYCYFIGIITSHGMVITGVTLAIMTSLSMTIYIALVCKLSFFRKIIGEKVKTSQGEPDARTRKVTIQSSVLVAWYSMTYLPYGIYLFYIGVTKEDPAVEVKTVRHLVLTLAPFVGTLVDPVIVFYQLGFYKPVLRKLSHFCNIHTAAVNDKGLTISKAQDTSTVGPSSVCGAARATRAYSSNKLVSGDSGFRDASDTLQTDGVV